MLNAYWEPLTFELPPVAAESRGRWRRCVDRAATPDDFCPWETAPFVEHGEYIVQPRSMVVLLFLQPR